jgi:hypothetical protein
MRNGIQLQPGRLMLVRGGIRAPADAARWRELPVPRLPAQGGGAGWRKGAIERGSQVPLPLLASVSKSPGKSRSGFTLPLLSFAAKALRPSIN